MHHISIILGPIEEEEEEDEEGLWENLKSLY